MAGTRVSQGFVALLALFLSVGAHGQSIWTGGGLDNNWSSNANWLNGAAPVSSAGAWIRLQGSARLAPLVDSATPWILSRLEFQSSSDPAPNSFSLSGNPLSLEGAGPEILVWSSAPQTIGNDVRIPQGTLRVDGPLTLAGNMSGSGGLNITAEVTLTGENDHDGITTVGNGATTGALTVGHSNALGSTAGGTVVGNGSSLALGGGVAVVGESLSLGSGSIAAGLVNASGNNTWTGAITLATNAVIESKTSGDVLTLSGSFDWNHKSLSFTGAGNTVLAGPISNLPNSTLIKNGAGTLTIAGMNAGVGQAIVPEGALVLTRNEAIAQNALIDLTPASIAARPTLRILQDTFLGTITSQSGLGTAVIDVGENNLTIGAGWIVPFAGEILGTGSITKLGFGRWTVAIANDFSATLLIENGRLRITQDSDLGPTTGTPSGTLVLNGGALEALSSNSVILNPNRTIHLAERGGAVMSSMSPPKEFIVAGRITGMGELRIQEAAVRLSHPGNDYTGGTLVEAFARLTIDTPNALGGSGANVRMEGSGVLTTSYALDQALLMRLRPDSAGTVALSGSTSNDLDFAGADLQSVFLGAVGTQEFGGKILAADRQIRLTGADGTLNLTRANALSNVGGVEVGTHGDPRGRVILSNDNEFSGDLNVDRATLEIRQSILECGEARAGYFGKLELADATLNAEHIIVEKFGFLTGCGTISGEVINHGQITVNCGNLQFAGAFTNNGRLTVLDGSTLSATGPLVNNGVLDLSASPETALPEGLVNNGTVLHYSRVAVQSATKTGATFSLVVRTSAPNSCQLQRSPSLINPAWENVNAARRGDAATDLVLQDSAAPSTGMFYRVLVTP